MQPAYMAFGETPFAARFFSAVLGVLTILVTFLYAKRLFNQSVAYCAALALALSTHFLFEFRLAVPDPYLIFFSTLGTFAAFTYLQQGTRSQLFIAAAAFALATLAKGPVAIGLPGIALLLWVLARKKWSRVFDWSMIIAALIFLAVALPWYIAVHQATNGQWTEEFFFKHNLNRFSEEMEGHGGIFLITIAIVVIGMLPFTAFLGQLLKRKIVYRNELVQFAALVTLVFTIFYSVSSTKLPNYPMPCYPFFAVVLGSFISALIDGKIQVRKYPVFIILGVMLVIPVVGYFAILQEVEAKHVAWIALILLFAPLVLLVLWLLNRKADWFKLITILGISYTVFNVFLLHIVYPALYSQDPVSKTITTVKQHEHIYAYQVYNPGYNFYLGQNIKEFTVLDSVRNRLAQYPGALIISRNEFTAELKTLGLEVIASHHDIFESPTTIILKQHATKTQH
jgi:4-amino-4-deoxy-L-arabinose transferase-like glycosyltransferase